MTNYCILCKSSVTSASSYHRFPKDKDRRSKWLQAIKMNQVSQFALLCSNHFKLSDYQETLYGLRGRLKNTAIPEITSQKINCDNIASSSDKEFHIEIQQNTCKKQSGEIKIEECNMKCNDGAKDNPNSLKRKSMENKEVDFPLKHIKYIKDINVCQVSRNPDEAAMVLDVAIETITEQAKKIQYLQVQACKLKKRVQNLTELNKHLHDNNLISKEALEHMNQIIVKLAQTLCQIQSPSISAISCFSDKICDKTRQ
ncbi:PREDICTED: THAP domain-containing protein 2-like isoform X1 [Trachymyrmex cornetzi]|uniref:THAP domain-containing protein 2-like isoform X1 n=2 Tax=Trachymyrmex cornetzi TaxID=471704 RepID=UPI00084EE1EB|nr:PREDICTED: THAP domain-containing protein 2-like isoform X1 [Trachymyrmex cornetzi]